MTYNCKFCNFIWNIGEGDFKHVLLHEKTHRKSKDVNQDIRLKLIYAATK